MTVTFDIDLEKFRYYLVGDGFLLEEVEEMSEERLVDILTYRVNDYIEKEYQHSVHLGLVSKKRDRERGYG
jgi:hypothetical protein